MTTDSPAVSRSVEPAWLVKGHRIVIGKGLRTVLVDGVEHSLGGFIHRGPRTATFDLDGRDAVITSTRVAPTMMSQLRRRIVLGRLGGLRRFVMVLGLFGGPAAVGASAATGVTWLVWGWTIYDLRVSGEHHGSWVYCLGGQRAPSGWVFVPTGGALPQRDWIDWPTPPGPPAR